MRLEPIEQPKGLTLRFAYWMSKRMLGKVMTPLKVVGARAPRIARAQYAMTRVEQSGLILDPMVAFLVKVHVAMLNGCAFCVDIGKAIAVKERLSLEKIDALPDWRTSPVFEDRERAALAFVEEATRDKWVKDETFEAVRKHFSEREIVEITFLNALENYYNLMNIPLGIEEDGLCAIAQG